MGNITIINRTQIMDIQKKLDKLMRDDSFIRIQVDNFKRFIASEKRRIDSEYNKAKNKIGG